jgi:hypothetical protein
MGLADENFDKATTRRDRRRQGAGPRVNVSRIMLSLLQPGEKSPAEITGRRDGRHVPCPLGSRGVDLKIGAATGAYKGCAVRPATRLGNGRVCLKVGFTGKQEGTS